MLIFEAPLRKKKDNNEAAEPKSMMFNNNSNKTLGQRCNDNQKQWDIYFSL